MDKITWKMLFDDFKKVFPNLSKHTAYWKPFDWMKIEVIFDEGEHFIYDGFCKSGYFKNLSSESISNH